MPAEHLERTGGDTPEKRSSDRTFGLLFAAVFTMIGLFKASVIWLAGAAMFLGVALVRPGLLAPLHRRWLWLGDRMHEVTSPVIMAVLFFVVLTPVALLLWLVGKRPLRLRLDPAADSYWVDRVPPGPSADSMKQQF